MSGSKHEWVDSTVTAFKQLSGESGPKLYETSSVLLQTLYHALQTSTQSMLPTYTTSLPESSTTGTAVAIDLGGSTLRVLVIKLQGNVRNDENDTLQRTSDWKVLVRNSWPVEDEIKRSKLQDFFDWIADCVRKTITEAKLGSGQGKSVGVTWSFPVT